MIAEHSSRLVVMRHAKTESHAASDRVRRLTSRGVADSRAAGRWLAERELLPDLVLVSAALRARQTFEYVAEALGHVPEHRMCDELYGADVDEVLELVSRESYPAVMVVGHNPTMAELVHAVQEAPAESWPEHLPTAGLVVVEFPEPPGPSRGAGRLTATHVARG